MWALKRSLPQIGVALALLISFSTAARSADTVTTQPSTAIFAGGCFWCMQPPFDALAGVISTAPGYTGGSVANPTYQQVSSGETGHVEAIQVLYDPAQVNYAQLLDVFWHNIDPLAANAQFCDHGSQYGSAIFYLDAEQRQLAEESKSTIEKTAGFSGPIVTQIIAAGRFYEAEDYHRDYYKKNPLKYKFYRWNCGRDARLKQLWGAAAPSH